MNLKELLKNDRTQALEEILDTFEKNGYQIYVVGGAIRDLLLGEPVHDIDFTTDARPDQIEELFDRTLDVGARFGTIRVLKDDACFEITTFRKESGYTDGRHPTELEFGDTLSEDLERRDFTINSLAMDSEGNIIDLFDGQKDLENGIIRTVGNPEARFKEDELRKWRAVRFAAQKGFEIEKETYRALRRNPDTSKVSIERIRDEVDRLIMTDKANWGGYLLIRTGLYPSLLERVAPELLRLNENQDLVRGFELIPNLPTHLPLRLATLLLDTPLDNAETFLREMRYPNKVREETLKYLRAYPITIDDGIIPFKAMAGDLGLRNLEYLFSLQATVAHADLNKLRLRQVERSREALAEIRKGNHPLTRKDLALNGDDLIQLGYKGKEVQEILQTLLEHVYISPEDNTREKLFQLAQRR